MKAAAILPEVLILNRRDEYSKPEKNKKTWTLATEEVLRYSNNKR